MRALIRSGLILLCPLLVPLAAAAWQSALAPRQLLELHEQAAVAYDAEDGAAAARLYQQLVDASPDDPELWYALSRAHEWNGEISLAIAAGERAQTLGYMRRAPFDYRLAKLHARAGHTAEALRWLALSLQHGLEDRAAIAEDDAFANLGGNAEFLRLAGIPPNAAMSRAEGMRFDIDYLVEEAQRLHASPRREAYSVPFIDAAGELKKAAPQLSDTDFYVGAGHLLAILNDGHTGLFGPDRDSPLQLSGNVLPLKFYWFAEGLYIAHGIGDANALAGMRVLKLGDLTTAQALAAMEPLRGVDNAMTWKSMGPQFYLVQMQLLQHIGATDSVERVRLTLEAPDGRVSEHVVEGGRHPFQRTLQPAAGAKVPLYLSRPDANYWLQSLPAQRALYFQFNKVRDSDEQAIPGFAAALGERLRDDNASTLIVDVRHNGGGNNMLLRPLVRTIVAFEQAAPEHRVFVIMGRDTFSAAQNFINRVESLTNAVFVGEPSSSSPNFVGETTDLLLPWSRLRGSISSQYWQDSYPDDHRPWIAPDLPVAPTAADYFAGRDAALAAVLEVIGDSAEQ